MDFSRIDLSEHQRLAREIIKIASSRNFNNRREFEIFRNKIIKQKKGRIFHNLYFIKAYNDLIGEGLIQKNDDLLKLIMKRGVRTLSGVAPVTVLTKPYPCPGKCIYCPTDERMPKSYLPSQPAAQRAFRQQFDPYTQIFVRLKALKMTGHDISKVELRIIGGTWSYYPGRYQTGFIQKCLLAMNEFYQQIENGKYDDISLHTKTKKIKSIYGVDEINTVIIRPLHRGHIKFEDTVKQNETGKVRCIGINIETRPDFINVKEVKRLRNLGVTKVELGVQTLFDDVQEKCRRGHNKNDTVNATRLLKDAGFKVGYHMMPNLPGSNITRDKKMIKMLFSDELFNPDYLKIYPCVVLPRSALFNIYNKGDFNVYNDDELTDILFDNLKNIPEWCRVDRISRDIPSNEIGAGFKVSNIRQILDAKAKKEGVRFREIRSREIRDEKFENQNIRLIKRKYKASKGVEYFITYEDNMNDRIVALLRLRFPGKPFLKELKNSALIREVHVYGRQMNIGEKKKNKVQHSGFGKKLLSIAEEISKKNGYKKLTVIAGIGTREYYKKLGFKKDGTYMSKHFM